MAGPFYNPQAGMGIEAAGASAVVSPTRASTISGADAVTAGLNLATQGVSLYGQYQRSQGRSGGTRSGSPDPNVAVFAEEMNKVEQIRSEQGDLAGRLAERAVASNFAAAGVSFKDKAYKSVYESTTGRSFDVYGRDDDEYFRQKALERPEVQAAFVASKAILPPGTSTESKLEWSLNEVSKQQAAAYYVNKAQSNATVAWQSGGDEDSGSSKAFKEVRSAFMAGTLGALMQRYESGQVVTPKDIADAKVEWTSLSAGPLRRPPNLSGADGDAQWEAFQEGNKSIDNFFTTLESASSSKTLLDTQIAIIADAVNKSDGMTALEKLVTITGLLQGDSAVYDSLVAGNLGDLYEKLRNVKIPPTATPDAIVTDPPPGSGRRNYEVDPDELAKYQGMTGKEISNQVVATAGHAKVFDPSSIGNAQNQATFGKTMTGMIAALQSSNQGDFFSPAYLKENVLNPKILATLKALEKFDPDQADKLRGGLQLGYQMEKMRQLQNLSSIETGDLAKFTRFNEQTNSYELNVGEFGARFGKDIVAFNDALGSYYNNNLSEAAKDGFNKFYKSSGGRVSSAVGNPQNIISSANLAGLTSAVKRRDAIAALDKGISNLNPDQGIDISPRPTDQGIDISPRPTDQGIDISPRPTDQGIDISPRPTDQGIDISPRPTDEEDGRSLLQRGLDLIFSPAAASELTPELRAQLEAVRTNLPPLPTISSSQRSAYLGQLGAAGRSAGATQFEESEGGVGVSTPALFTKEARDAVDTLMFYESGELFPDNPYNAWNRGSVRVNGVDKFLPPTVPGKTKAKNNIENLTLTEHIRRNELGPDDPERLFAVGKYQIIPKTAEAAFKGLGLSPDTKYSKAVQDAMFEFIIKIKQKEIAKYITGMPGGDRNKAIRAFAGEFASGGIPEDEIIKGRLVKKGGGVYSGQKAKSSPEKVGKALDTLKSTYQDNLSAFVEGLTPDTFVGDESAAIDISPRPSEGQDQGNFNVGLGRDPVTNLPISLTEEYPSESAVKQKIQRTQEAARNAGILSGIVDFVPFVGDVKAGAELIDSFDEDSSPVAKGINAAAFALGVIPVAGDVAGKALKGSADDVAKFVDEFVENTSIIPEVSNESPPKKVVKAYKLFREVKGKLYPLFVDSKTEIVQGKWLKAITGEADKTGKVKSKLGPLAFRPGWHAGDKAGARHIGGKIKGENKPSYRPANQVWAEVEYPDDFNWQAVADSRASVVQSGPNKGKPRGSEAHITDQIPFGGHYSYKTNPNMEGKWLISGDMKVNKRLPSSQVSKMGDDLPTLPELIEKRNLTLNDIPANGLKELKEYYPDVYQRLLKE